MKYFTRTVQSCGLAVVALVCLTACPTPIPPPQPPGPPPTPNPPIHHDLTWTVTTEAGAPLLEATITLEPDPGTGATRTTDGEGFAHFGATFGVYLATVTRDGYATWSDTVSVGGPRQVAVTLTALAPPQPTWPVVEGRVRLDHRTFIHGSFGPRPSVGASLFWLAWGTRHDRARVEQNVRWLAERDVDFVRAFAEVCTRHGHPVWEGREIDPEWPDYATVLQESTRLVMAYGMRVEWTLFAGGCYDEPHEWLAVGDRMIDALRPVLDGVQFVEVANEEQLPNRAVVRELARRVRDRLGVEVALTSPYSDYGAWYVGSAATIGTYHPDRAEGDYGWRFARQMWSYPDELAPGYTLPAARVNNEPTGIDASVVAVDDPVRLASDALVTWVSGGAAYVWHSGAGIFGRASDDGHGRLVRANLWEQPTADASLRMIDRVRDALPGDLPNWQRANNQWTPPNPTPPFRFTQDQVGTQPGVIRAYTAVRGTEFYTVALGARGTLQTDPVWPVEATVRELREWVARPWTGTLTGTDSTYLVIGR